MRPRLLTTKLFPAVFCSIATFLFAAAPSQAQQGQQAALVAAFQANPGKLLTDNPDGGARLVSQIRDLAVADAADLQPILNLIANANKDQKASIGAGLAQAARLVVRSNPAYANQIQVAIANLKDQDVMVAYTSVAGDLPIGASAGVGSGGGVGGQTSALPNGPSATGPAIPFGGGSVGTGAFNYSSSVTGLFGPTSSSTSTTGVADLVSQ